MNMQQLGRRSCNIGAIAIASLHVFFVQSAASAADPGITELLTALSGSTAIVSTPIVLFNGLVVSAETNIPTVTAKNGRLHESNGISQQVQVDLSIPYNVILGQGFDADLQGQLLTSQALGVDHTDLSAVSNARPILEIFRKSDAKTDITYLIESEVIAAMFTVAESMGVSLQGAAFGNDLRAHLQLSSRNFRTWELTPWRPYVVMPDTINVTALLNKLRHSNAWPESRVNSTFFLMTNSNAIVPRGSVSMQASGSGSIRTRQMSALVGISNIEGNDFASPGGGGPNWNEGQRETVPEPSALAALALGLSLVIARRTKR